jgi:hypothetical protein
MSLAFDLAALVVIVIHTQQCCDVNVLWSQQPNAKEKRPLLPHLSLPRSMPM